MRAVDEARAEVERLGLPPEVAPPVRLDDCDEGTIQTALDSPRAGFMGLEAYPDLPSKAAVLTYTLSKSQACIDGNKRVAFILLNEFLSMNGAALEMPQDEAAEMILFAATSNRDFRDQVILELTQILQQAIVPLIDVDPDEEAQ